MKKIAYGSIVLILLGFMFLSPQAAVEASKEGVLLWANTILPTLLPFMIFSNLIIQLNVVSYMTFFLAPILHPLFGISKNGCYALVIGFLCGYPMGAKVTSDMTANGMISKQEGQYLLGFCNNVSPTFLLTFVLLQCLNRSDLALPTLVIAYGAPITYGLLSGIRHRRLPIRNQNQLSAASLSDKKKSPPKQINFELVDTCIMDGFENITKLGGYIILFSIVIRFLLILPIPSITLQYLIVGLTEITNGIKLVSASAIPFEIQYVILMAILTFGGFSSIAQTESMIKKSGLSLRKYITAKMITMLIAGAYAVVFLKP